ncbi:MAG: glutathione-disulfide reductase [Myxococcales bacterium]|nr:glutathione-disulfide reductase [Myxococcales bacterium]TDJ02515.1 MAG: glutathione-disulfide reductase [Deltaproteobacteria bacterium]
MARYDYDLFTIGAGSGGVRASRVSAGLGARVAIAEERYLGGTCVNVGCIPKKLLVYASHYTEDFEDARAYGWTVGKSSFDWATLIRNKDREIARLNEVYRKLLDQSGVKQIEGRARIVDQNTVAIGDRTFSAKNILIATGSWPSVPEIPGIEHAITSNEAFHLKQLPRRVIVVGGGYIAVEFASIFHGLGAETTELYRGPLFLRGFDHDVRQVLAEEMRKKEIDLRFDLNIESIEQADDHLLATLSDGSKLEADQIMYATGRLPATSDLGLEEAGVELNQKGAVVVDEFSRSTVANIWAIGDVTDRINLTPVAIHEGMALAETLFHDRPTKPDHENVASAVFSQPQIGAVGLNETKARERYTELEIFRTRFRPLKHTLTGQDETTMMKLIVDRASGRVVGAHMVGPEAGEIIQGIAIAIKCRATKAEFDATIGLHPTSAEEFVTMRESVVN